MTPYTFSGSVESLDDSNFDDAVSFLMEHENFSLFLLGNLEACGSTLTGSPNSGNFKLIRSGKEIIAVFCLTRRGNLVVQSSLHADWVFQKILDACKEETVSISGLLGEWSFCEKFWKLLKEKRVIQKDLLLDKEILYVANLREQTLFDDPNVRLLNSEDFDQWKHHRMAYLKEQGLPHDLSTKELHELFLENVKKHICWGYFKKDLLVAMAELNAKAKDLGQVGGVYTAPAFRRQGFAEAVMHVLMKDCRDLHKLRKLIIFTGETNLPARKLYESLHVHSSGYYALLFGENNE